MSATTEAKYLRQEADHIRREGVGYCDEGPEGIHCDRWWDGRAPCTYCGFFDPLFWGRVKAMYDEARKLEAQDAK